MQALRKTFAKGFQTKNQQQQQLQSGTVKEHCDLLEKEIDQLRQLATGKDNGAKLQYFVDQVKQKDKLNAERAK